MTCQSKNCSLLDTRFSGNFNSVLSFRMGIPEYKFGTLDCF